MSLKDPALGNQAFTAEQFRNRWSKYREALRREDQLIFDRLFQAPAELEPDRSATCNTFETQVIAMLLEQRRISRELEAKLAALERSLREIEMKFRDFSAKQSA